MGKEKVSAGFILSVIGLVLVVVFGAYFMMKKTTPPVVENTNQNNTISITDENIASGQEHLAQKNQNIPEPLIQNTKPKSMTGEEFLAQNKTKEGVITTTSGLQYKVIHMGTGSKPTAAQTVNVDYEGRLINGTVFDSSYKRGEPIEFPLNGVIAGWTEGLQYMPVGSKFEFYIPSNLAYGPRGAGGLIGPNETLIFEVELHAIK